MKLCVALLLLPTVIAGPPDGWGCHSLNKLGATDADCVDAANFDGNTWDIQTKKVGSDRNRLCVVSLTGEGVEKVKDFYVTAKFNTNSKPLFAGVTYNMEDNQHGNYILMRMKSPVSTNMEVGYLEDGSKIEAQLGTNEGLRTGSLTLELLVRDGEETLYINGVKDEAGSSYEPYYYHPGTVGIGLQNVNAWILKVSDAKVCNPVQCTTPEGTVISGGDSYVDDDGKTCTCSATGIDCVCGDNSVTCPGGTTKWTDPDTCESKCIRGAAYCSSSGDPHYRTFDGKYYDYHGECTYQAASCGDFEVFFKNYNLAGPVPTYTGRIELQFKNQVFTIMNRYVAKVDGVQVQVPYVKHYTNGDRVEIVNNGQLEMNLYSKGRSPSVRLRASNGGTYINAEMWLHGSCLDITEGLCGNANQNPADDLINNTPNEHGEHYKEYDENCPKPQPPYHPCDDITDGYELAAQICDDLKKDPFRECNGAVSIGDKENGLYKNCQTDVCHCFIDETCACSTYANYATQCKAAGVDIDDYLEEIEYCPLECPDGLVYKPRGSVPAPSCLNKDPDKTGTERGCFCPSGKLLQDGVCIDASQCKCLYEGEFYNNGDKITKEGECKICTCKDAGEMVCEDMKCPELNCDDDELVAYKDDVCCPYCDDSWVIAVNPEETIKKGQGVKLTCEVRAKGVSKKNIAWYKGDKKITKGLSKNRLILSIKNGDADDAGTYRCQATKDGKVKEAEFEVEVIMPAICTHEDGTEFEEGKTYNPQDTEECTCDALGKYECACIDDGEECEGATPVTWFADNCVKTCVPEPGLCSAAVDPHYTSFDGSEFDFKGDCKYNFFSCGDIAVYADHEKDKASTHTKSLDVVFKNDVYKLEGDKVTLDGKDVTIPLHKTYGDGSVLTLSNIGDYKLTIVQDGKDPLVELAWDRQASYYVKVHGTCKGESTGLCGNWNDDAEDDYTDPEGKVADSIEAFGTSWALDDEEDCPEPEPPVDICVEYGLEKAEPTAHLKKVLKSGSMLKCSKVVDTTETINAAVQQICQCFGDNVCACEILEQLALQCEQKGLDMDNWRMDNKYTECSPECPDGTVFKAKGPKPVPTCAKPNGGRKTQRGCFCTDGKVLEDGKCISKDECKCEYAGELYDIGDKYNKEGKCETCTCVGSGTENCVDMPCEDKCKTSEIEVKVEGKCCPECQADWVKAVNPEAEGTTGKALALTCEVNGVTIDKDNVKWYKFNPGETDITKTKKSYTVSKDGLTLTIKKMDATRVGNYKCVVEKDGKKSEAKFEVTLPIRHEDLIEPVKETVAFVEGGKLVLEVNKLGGVIKEIYWVCNGQKVTKAEKRISISNKPKFNRLVINPATLEDQGSCTCHAKGVGTQDSAEINVGGKKSQVTVTPVATDVACVLNKKNCRAEFSIVTDNGTKVPLSDVQVCKLVDGKRTDCVEASKKGNNYQRWMGKKIQKTVAGDYICVVTYEGEETLSEVVTITVS